MVNGPGRFPRKTAKILDRDLRKQRCFQAEALNRAVPQGKLFGFRQKALLHGIDGITDLAVILVHAVTIVGAIEDPVAVTVEKGLPPLRLGRKIHIHLRAGGSGDRFDIADDYYKKMSSIGMDRRDALRYLENLKGEE